MKMNDRSIKFFFMIKVLQLLVYIIHYLRYLTKDKFRAGDREDEIMRECIDLKAHMVSVLKEEGHCDKEED